MTLFDHIDLMSRGGSLALLALWSWLLIRDHGGVLAARLAVAMNLAVACYLIVTASPYAGRSVPQLLLALGAGATPGLFWLFAKAWFNDEKRVSPLAIGLVLLSVFNVGVLQLTFPDQGVVGHVSGALFRIGMLAFATAGLWEAWRGRDGDLIEGRRRFRLRLIVGVGIYVVLVAFAEVAVQNGFGPSWLLALVEGSIVLIAFGYCAAMFGMRQADLFATEMAAPKPVSAPQSSTGDHRAERLLAHMEAELPHRDETLSIAKLAAQLGEQEYRLRRTINQQLGHRNFASFLNGYRLAEVRAALEDPAQREVPIITLALDAGFGSLGPFNRAFRESEAMTPSEYRARAGLADSGIG